MLWVHHFLTHPFLVCLNFHPTTKFVDWTSTGTTIKSTTESSSANPLYSQAQRTAVQLTRSQYPFSSSRLGYVQSPFLSTILQPVSAKTFVQVISTEIQLVNTVNPVTLHVLLVQVGFRLGVLLVIQLTTGNSLEVSAPVKLGITPILLEAQYVWLAPVN